MQNRKTTEADSEVVTWDEIFSRVWHAANTAADKKAFEIDVLHVGELTSIAEYFVICSTGSERQSAAVADAIEERLRVDHGVKPLTTEGRSTSRWILIDYGDFVVHVFTEECRKFYSLERLWGDAPNVAADIIGKQPAPSA